MVQIVERALSENPSLRKGVILEQLYRNDFFHLANLTSIYNTTLKQLVAASPHHHQLVVVGQPSLVTAKASLRRHTDSVLTALKSAGLPLLGGWGTQGRQGAARVQPSGRNSQAAETNNSFHTLN